MKPSEFSALKLRQGQRGISIIAAIFLLLLFAAIAAFMVSMSSTTNVISAQDMQGARAYQAAQSGIEWGVFQLDPTDTAVALPACFANTTLNQYAGFSVLVACTRFGVYTEGTRTLAVYQIVATATVPGAIAPPAAVERQAEARIAKCFDASVSPRIFNC